MKTILYENNLKKTGSCLGKKIQEELCDMEMEMLSSVKSLSKKLCQPLNRILVVVLVLHTREEITDFLKLIPLFENIRIILLLPDREKKTVALGLQLNPSFISYADSDLKDITEVLKKIQKITKEK